MKTKNNGNGVIKEVKRRLFEGKEICLGVNFIKKPSHRQISERILLKIAETKTTKGKCKNEKKMDFSCSYGISSGYASQLLVNRLQNNYFNNSSS